SDRLEKRLEIARQIYNTLLNYELIKLHRLESDSQYQEIQSKLKADPDQLERKKLYISLNKIRKNAGFTEYGFTRDIKNFYKHFNDNIGSNVAVHGIAPQVWASFDRLFFGNGKTVHFKRRGELNSIRGYSVSGKSGGVEIIFRGTFIEWKGLKLPIKLDPNNEYESELLQKRVKYCRIVKKPGKNANRWYVMLMLECKPAVKVNKDTGEVLHPVGHGAVGIDIGPQTIAYVSDKEADLKELADQVNNIELEKRVLQRKLDRSRRASNPDNYAANGTIKLGVKLTHHKSKKYIKTQLELANLQRRQADIRKRQHNELANHLMSLGDRFYVEDMEWPSLTHRAKKTEISEKTGKYKRKKRFGKSIGNKAPATLIRLLDTKLKSRGLEGVIKVSTSVRASQYNHQTDDYRKKELSERWNDMPDGRRIQRDLYSAFLLQHMNKTQTGFDRNALTKDYERFVTLHDRCMEELRLTPKTIASMGLVRRSS
ncbi:MAG: transposase, partial [Clostridia bacterium]|nr:transposase [Clostridia bacterium]